MTSIDDAVGPLVKSVLDSFGKSVTFQTVTNSYDPATGLNTETVTDVIVNVSPPDKYNDRLVDGDLIRRGDAMIIVAAKDLSFTPSTKTKVTIDLLEWNIVNTTPVYSGEDIAAYELQIRK